MLHNLNTFAKITKEVAGINNFKKSRYQFIYNVLSYLVHLSILRWTKAIALRVGNFKFHVRSPKQKYEALKITNH